MLNTDARNPDAITAVSDYGTDDEPNWTAERARNNRIEALRAASRIVAGMYAGQTWPQDEETGKEVPAHKSALSLAKQFARWLETGER